MIQGTLSVPFHAAFATELERHHSLFLLLRNRAPSLITSHTASPAMSAYNLTPPPSPTSVTAMRVLISEEIWKVVDDETDSLVIDISSN